jgi:hypothetical protein
MSTCQLTPEQKIRQCFAWFQEAQRWGNEDAEARGDLRKGVGRAGIIPLTNHFLFHIYNQPGRKFLSIDHVILGWQHLSTC